MAALTEVEHWDDEVFRIETDTVWIGGEDGAANNQGRQLANRTAYLKALIESLGVGKQDAAVTLSALATLVGTADTLPYFTGNTTAALTGFTAFARTVVAATDAATARAVLGAASPADIGTAITALVNSSPAALDTLNELATALGDDPNFATTITNALAVKAPLASPVFEGMPTAPTAAGGTNTTQLATTAFVLAALAGISGQQPGEVAFFARSTAPAGFLKANGALVSRTTYAALFAAIGTTFSLGDGSTTFGLPDLRGEFVRGLDDGRGIDASRSLGSFQKGSEVGFEDTNESMQIIPIAGTRVAWGYDPSSSDIVYQAGLTAASFPGNNVVGAPNPGGEYRGTSRPRNIALLACIKY